MYAGLIGRKFKLNRPLTKQERADCLPRNLETHSKPTGMASVIKMNSTYLECVDKYYWCKGQGASMGIPILVVLLGFFAFFISTAIDDWITRPQTHAEQLGFLFTLLISFSFIFAFVGRGVYKEAKWTHMPIRFNRKNRKVYVFRFDGTVLTANWDDIFFTYFITPPLLVGSKKMCNVVGHILDKDGVTVLETFVLPTYSELERDKEDAPMYQFWEFVRRYMEGDDNEVKKLLPYVGRTMNVSNRRETMSEGFMASFVLGFKGGFLPKPLIVHPADAAVTFFGGFHSAFILPSRKILMLLGDIPKWTPEIEAECKIDPNDPYICDESHPPLVSS